jgi:hypothetical protein
MSRERLKVMMTLAEPWEQMLRSSSMPSNRVDDFFDGVGQLGLGFFGTCAGERAADGDGGEIDRGQAIDAQAGVGGGADDDQADDDHAGEDRAGDEGVDEAIHELRGL